MCSDAPAIFAAPAAPPQAAGAGEKPRAAGGDQREVVVRLRDVGKRYEMYDKPSDRLKQALLRWRGVRLCKDFWALRGLDLDLRRGEAVGILGRNGSGKSTLLQMIAGTLAPTTGTVEVAGRIAALLELGSGFNPEFTGRENVFLNGALLGFSRREVQERFDAIARFADIGEFLDQPVKTYSSGMLVRLAFAVQVQLEPDVLIVDEALAVGDALFQKRCYQRIHELRDKGVALLFVSHDMEVVRTLTDRAILLDKGRCVASGEAAEVVLAYRKLLHDAESAWFAQRVGGTNQHAQAERSDSGGAAQADAAGDALPAAALPAAALPAAGGAEFGDLDAQIVSVRVLDGAGEPASVFSPGDELRVRVEARTRRELSRLNVALRVRNKQGVKMYSWGTLNQDIAIWAGRAAGEIFWDRTFPAGARICVEFRCVVGLGQDLYEVQAGVSEEQDRFYNAQRTLHWRDEAAFFQVLVRKDEYFFGGVADMKMVAHVVH